MSTVVFGFLFPHRFITSARACSDVILGPLIRPPIRPPIRPISRKYSSASLGIRTFGFFGCVWFIAISCLPLLPAVNDCH